MDNNELVICQGLTKNYGKKTALIGGKQKCSHDR